MKKLFYSHPDTILVILALAFIGILITFYSWAVNDIFTEIHQALTFSSSQPVDSFDLVGAGKLDLRGLLNAPSSAPAPAVSAPPAFVPSMPTTTAATATILQRP